MAPVTPFQLAEEERHESFVFHLLTHDIFLNQPRLQVLEAPKNVGRMEAQTMQVGRDKSKNFENQFLKVRPQGKSRKPKWTQLRKISPLKTHSIPKAKLTPEMPEASSTPQNIGAYSLQIPSLYGESELLKKQPIPQAQGMRR